MDPFKAEFLRAIIDAQKIKLAVSSGQAQSTTFYYAVENAYQLLSLNMPSPESEARKESDVEWTNLNSSMELQRKQISTEENNKPSDTNAEREFRIASRIEVSKMNHYDRFLGILIGIGHKYNLYPREIRLEPSSSIGSGYGGITD